MAKEVKKPRTKPDVILEHEYALWEDKVNVRGRVLISLVMLQGQTFIVPQMLPLFIKHLRGSAKRSTCNYY